MRLDKALYSFVRFIIHYLVTMESGSLELGDEVVGRHRVAEHSERAPRRAGLALGARRGATIRERNRVEACGRWCRGDGVYGDSWSLPPSVVNSFLRGKDTCGAGKLAALRSYWYSTSSSAVFDASMAEPPLASAAEKTRSARSAAPRAPA